MKLLLKSLINPQASTVNKGKYYEQIAKDYLTNNGLNGFQFNYYSRFGEIDIIARDKETLVFIEVRYRKDKQHGSAAATVDIHKQKKIIRTAQHFLQKNGLTNKMPCRFDVIAITGITDEFEILWIKNAF